MGSAPKVLNSVVAQFDTLTPGLKLFNLDNVVAKALILNKKLVIVAGALGGLGSQIAAHLSRQYEVIGLGRSTPLQTPEKYRYISLNLFDVEEMREFCEREVDSSLYGVVNCIGSVANNPIWKMTRSEWDDALNNNVTSCFSLLSTFAPQMRANGVGRFLFLSSVVARRGSFGASHYAAAKGAIESLTKSVAIELASKNITVNAIAPGYMDAGIIRSVPTDILSGVIEGIPQKRLGPSTEICFLAEYLLSENASYITGETLGINGGL